MTRAIADRARAFLAAWHSRRPTVAVMGEFSSGKSALLNCLLGRDLLTTRATATDLPAVWITAGPTDRIRGLDYEGRLHDLDLADLSSPRAMQFLCLRVETRSDLLERLDIIDTPGISDPRMTTEIVEEVARNVDFVVWCSPINQAWRQSERGFWNSLPDACKTGSILALTRADLMARPQDIDRVVRRCTSEAAGFSAVLPVSAPLAVAALAAGQGDTRSQMLEESGLRAFVARLSESVAQAEAACEARPNRDEPNELAPLALTEAMGQDESGEAKRKGKPARKKQSVAKRTQKTAARNGEDDLVRSIVEAVNNCSPDQQGLDTIRHSLTRISRNKTIAAEHRDVLLRALSFEMVDESRIERILTQARHETEDFAVGPWCDLRQQIHP